MKKFNVFDPVLVRANSNANWHADFYDHLTDDGKRHQCIASALVKDENILPYNEETKHLHNTVGEFVKWKPKKGEPILVRDDIDATWTFRIFMRMQDTKFECTLDPNFTETTSGAVWDCAKPYVNPFKE